ncbi:MAG: TIGR04283 family arsenosugar biosynthesis glycosyltransferase [Lacipirellulaceae bacterium]
MNLSIIIPTLDEAATIEVAIDHAWNLSPAEVIVVDGGSEDETESLAKRKASKVFQAPRGRGPQQNAGAALAAGDVLLFLHADTWLAPQARKQLETDLADKQACYGAFRQSIDARGGLYRLLEAGNTFRARQLRIPYGDQGLFFRREFFESIGGFPNIPLMEDLRLMRALRKSGHSPTILPGPIVVSARRWQEQGIVRQTLLNWSLAWKDRRGESADRLAARYGKGQRTTGRASSASAHSRSAT